MNYTSYLLAAAVCAFTSAVGDTTSQLSVDYPAMPAPLEKAVDATDMIVRGRLVSVVNATYDMPSVRGDTSPMPVTLFTVSLVETLKGPRRITDGRDRLEFRKVGFFADERSDEEVKKRADLGFPALKEGHEYVFFLLSNQVSMLWLQYGGQGVFEERDGTVRSVRPSKVAAAWNGKSWNQFLKVVRDRATESNKRLHPTAAGADAERPRVSRVR